MEELLELKDLLIKGDIKGALAIAEELEEMSRDDKITAIGSYAVILLLHLIKQQVEHNSFLGFVHQKLSKGYSEKE